MARDRLAAVRAQANAAAPIDFHPRSRSPSIVENAWETGSSHSRSRSTGSASHRRIASANNSYDNLDHRMPSSSHSDRNPFENSPPRAWDPPQQIQPARTVDRGFSNPFENNAAPNGNSRLPVNGGPPSFRRAHSYNHSSVSVPQTMHSPSVRNRVAQFEPNRDSVYSEGNMSPMTGGPSHYPGGSGLSSGAEIRNPFESEVEAAFYPGPAYIAGNNSHQSPIPRPRSLQSRPSFRTTKSYSIADFEKSPLPDSQHPQFCPSPVPEVDIMETFFEEITNIQNSIRTYGDNVTRIETLHNRSLNTMTDSPEYNRVMNDLDRVTDETRSLSNELRSRIKELERTNGQVVHPQDANVKRTQTASVKNRFIEAIQRYSQMEAAHRAQSRGRLAKQYRIVNPNATDDEVRTVCEDPQASEMIFRQGVLNTNRNGEARAALSAVQARHADILQIEQTIVELAQLFQDMSIMVEEQDAAIVRIEENAVGAQRDMEQAHVELVHAKASAKSARSKRKWCFVILLVLVLATAGVVVYFVMKNRSMRAARANEEQQNVSGTVGGPVAATTSDQAIAAEQSTTAAPVTSSDIPSTSLEPSTVTETVVHTATATETEIATSVSLVTNTRYITTTLRATPSARNTRRQDNSDFILPRAMNWEQRARAWPFLDAEYEEDSVDSLDGDFSDTLMTERTLFQEDVAPNDHPDAQQAGLPWAGLMSDSDPL